VDGGGFTGAQGATAESRAMFLVEATGTLGYDALTVGAPDTELGAALLRAVLSDTTRPFVTTNLRDAESGERLAAPSQIVTKGNVRFGIASMLPPSETARFAAIGLEVTDAAMELEPVLRDLRDQCDVVVLLARAPLRDAQAFVEKFPDEIDVVVVASGEPGRGVVGREHGGAVFVQTGNKGQAVGVARIAMAEKHAEKIAGEEVVLSRDYPEDPDLKKLVDDFQTNLNTILQEHQVRSVREHASPDGQYYIGAQACAQCHREEYTRWLETPHASAYQTLVDAGREALPECFSCHVTGASDPAGFDPGVEQALKLVNVQCEVCHDKGSVHTRDGSYGRDLLMQSCATCHDPANSPDFDPNVYWLMMEH
jgi:hypothetical protein